MPRHSTTPPMNGSFRLYGARSYDEAVERADAAITALLGGADDRRWWMSLEDGDPEVAATGDIVAWSFNVKFSYPEHPAF